MTSKKICELQGSNSLHPSSYVPLAILNPSQYCGWICKPSPKPAICMAGGAPTHPSHSARELFSWVVQVGCVICINWYVNQYIRIYIYVSSTNCKRTNTNIEIAWFRFDCFVCSCFGMFQWQSFSCNRALQSLAQVALAKRLEALRFQSPWATRQRAT